MQAQSMLIQRGALIQKPDQLADAIVTLYHDAPLREAMGKRGRRRVERDYSKQHVVARYDELLQRVAGAAGAETTRESR